MSTATATPIAAGDIYCVTAHPYMRWRVVAVHPGPGSEPEIVLRSTADDAVERVVALSVLVNPLRFQRAAAHE